MRTPLPLALLLHRVAGGLYEAWLGVEEVEGAADLLSKLSAGEASRDDIAAAMRSVRKMHDEGVEHRDLNLGNLLLRVVEGAPEGWVVDLDRARLHDAPLGTPLRRAGLERLQRSWLKYVGSPPVGGFDSTILRELYAGGDDALERALAAGRTARRLRFALHRLNWRR